MKIRQKLVLSFSSLLTGALILLALIFYDTFSTDIEKKRLSFDALKCEMIAKFLDDTIARDIGAMERYSIRNDVQTLFSNQSDSAHNVLFYSKSSEFIIAEKTISAITLLDDSHEPMLHIGSGGVGLDYKELMSEHPSKNGGVVSRILHESDFNRLALPHYDLNGSLLGNLLFHMPLQGVYQELSNFLNDSYDDSSAIVLTQDGKGVFTYNNFSDQPSEDLHPILPNRVLNLSDRDRLPSVAKNLSFHIFSCGTQLGNWTVHHIVPNSVFWESLSDLRSDLIITMAITLLLAVGIIIAIASQLTKPITGLVKATHDMIDQNYSTPLEEQDRNDELGDLTERFEIMRKKVKELIQRDPLTQIYNRRYLMTTLDRELQRAKRGDSSITCVMLDVDYFKKVNDTYGHQCGDEVLKSVAEILSDSVRTYDVAGRYGGEEFLLILSDTTPEEAIILAERIRTRIAEAPISWESHLIRITASLGVCGFPNGKCDRNIDILQKADEALYAAKESGRNRVVMFNG